METQFGKQSLENCCFNEFLDVKSTMALRHIGHLLNNPLTYEDIHEATGLSFNTLSTIANNKVKRADLATMERLLDYFSGKLGRQLAIADLLEYRPD